MPIPASFTLKMREALSAVSLAELMLTATSTEGVNLMALSIKLFSTWLRLTESPTKNTGTFSAQEAVSLIFFFKALRENIEREFSIISLRQKGVLSMVILPASIFERSRISLMITKRLSEQLII